jgi:hypothetical protein
MMEFMDIKRWISRSGGKRFFLLVHVLLMVITGLSRASAQPQGGPTASTAATSTPRALAPKDLTGYWVSVVTEDWRWRMVVPDKGDFASVPLNADGRKAASNWDPAKDQAAGEQCRSYGAGALIRVPGRLHITWPDNNTLRIDTDSGTQTRLLHFGASQAATGAPQWQGYSAAAWDGIPTRGPQARKVTAGEDPRGYLKVVTTHMRPGYLRKNGIPYSANASMEEYFDRFSEPNGDTWLVVTIIVTDPQYLTQPYVTHAQFKKLPDASGWDPTPCRADQAR